MAVRSFFRDFHLSKVRLVNKFSSLLSEKFQNSDTFYPFFVGFLPLRICRLKLLVVNKRQFCQRFLDSVFQPQFLIQK